MIMDERQYLNIMARIEAIKCEIEAAKLDNAIRIANGAIDRLNYPPEWFEAKARELEGLSTEAYRS